MHFLLSFLLALGATANPLLAQIDIDFGLSELSSQSSIRDHLRTGPKTRPPWSQPPSDKRQYKNISLDYAIHEPTLVNIDAKYVLYKNIRYAESPVGELRWAKPEPPQKIDEEDEKPFHDGSYGYSCFQAWPSWVETSLEQLNPDLDPEVFFGTATDGDDCLFLDVATPLEQGDDEKLPVVVWIYGGGFVYGKKDLPIYTPAGLYKRANGHKFIYVAMNYRLGAFGFLGGDYFTSGGGTPNLALWDQRLALQWIQDNIEKFGGDPQQVTVMGESAGASSIAHQLTIQDAGDTPFKRAIIQSPAWVPIPGDPPGLAYQDSTYSDFLEDLDCADLACARAAEPADIVAANRRTVANAKRGTFTYGPVVDNTAIKDQPFLLFQDGQQNQSVEIFTGVVGGEGFSFVPVLPDPWPRKQPELSDSDLINFMTDALPLMSKKVARDILDLYPGPWRNYTGISPQSERIAAIAGEALVKCNTRIFSTSYNNNTYNYNFGWLDMRDKNFIARLPLLHGQDVPYTFFDTQPAGGMVIDIAVTWQQYLMGFVLTGDPNLFKPRVEMKKYGEEANVLKYERNFWTIPTTTVVPDPYKGEHCDVDWPRIWDDYGENYPDEERVDRKKGGVDRDELR